MTSYLQRYDFEIKTLAPVFIGDGGKVNKKEYLYDRKNNRVILFDMKKMFLGLSRRNLLTRYEEYLLRDRRDLYNFFKENGIGYKEYEAWMLYQAPITDRNLDTKSTKEIFTFIKDPYGNPYVPGSSLKGALRTMIQSAYYLNHKDKANKVAARVKKVEKRDRRHFLEYEDKMMDYESVHRQIFQDTRLEDQNNDILRGLIIGDSKPLDKNSLCVCQKIDQSVAGEEKSMPLLRECLKSGLLIDFPITIDTSTCSLTKADIMDAVKQFYINYKEEFMNKFHKAPPTHGNSTTFFIGGGAGYASKTCSYAIMHGPEAVKTVSNIINETLPKSVQRKHNHQNDLAKHVSPHTLKVTKYNDDLKQMGAVCIKKFKPIIDKE